MDFVLNVNKPKEMTSHDVVRKVKNKLEAGKVGHAGTLDPLATGVLILCVNRATRLSQYFASLEKTYKAVLKLGMRTDTQDAYGAVIERRDFLGVDESRIVETLKPFEGRILQHPPMYSALKHKGTPLYRLARRGIEVERKQREVEVKSIKILYVNLPYIAVEIVCSKGTYIRTLCDEFGKRLGTGAHLYDLERMAVGGFNIEYSSGIEEFESMNDFERTGLNGIYSPDEALNWMPELVIEGQLIQKVRNGSGINCRELSALDDMVRHADSVRIKSPQGQLLAIAHYRRDKNELKMDIVLAG